MNIEKEKRGPCKPGESISEYEPPIMITYSEEELLEEIGPIQACSGFGGAVGGGC